ncbi:MAG: mannose-1-phosphate guanylyltransferase/mannose-6-phosphate isomerase [Porticoccus sp.]|nr:mannose-1-phosphate guanylyltransferase/mannose-6-phosphate isomerase [Porticoccus sp.]
MVVSKIVPVIMAGGSGTRLWPLSRQLHPKQFLPLVSEQTMLQETCGRLDGIDHLPPLFICGEEHRFTVAEQLRLGQFEFGHIILEPEGRNTAPAVALAALQAIKDNPHSEPVLLVLAADHVIRDKNAFEEAVTSALSFAEQGRLVTFGIVPKSPETGYGYIRMGDILNDGAAMVVDRFVEKPDQATAEDYLSCGEYLWNSGMFMFKASQFLSELEARRPDILAVCRQAMSKASVDIDFIRPDSDTFMSCPEDSIDYAVMEKTKDAVVVPIDCGWSDVGSWSALWEVSDKDANGNSIKGDVLALDSRNCFIQSDRKLIATVGLDGVVIVESDDAIMVADKGRVQDVKAIVSQLKKQGRPEASLHRKVYRPWGSYDSIDFGERFQVKRIVVKPGGKLSLQMHHHRAEHWIVVSGTARVTKGAEEFILSENESTYIPIGETHRLENPGAIPLEMIEVQSGSYLGEDDIVRMEDSYGRL